jgi:hypothetical protein
VPRPHRPFYEDPRLRNAGVPSAAGLSAPEGWSKS